MDKLLSKISFLKKNKNQKGLQSIVTFAKKIKNVK
jgi:hypothetical protein